MNFTDALEIANWYNQREPKNIAVAAMSRALLARIAALEAENERLLSQVCRWSESCTGRHGSQEQCVTLETSAGSQNIP